MSDQKCPACGHRWMLHGWQTPGADHKLTNPICVAVKSSTDGLCRCTEVGQPVAPTSVAAMLPPGSVVASDVMAYLKLSYDDWTLTGAAWSMTDDEVDAELKAGARVVRRGDGGSDD